MYTVQNYFSPHFCVAETICLRAPHCRHPERAAGELRKGKFVTATTLVVITIL